MPGDTFQYELNEGPRVLVLSGDLDESTTVELRELVQTLTSGLVSGLTLDLSEVTFLPSMAVGVLATSQAGARRNGADLVLVAQDGTVAQRVLRVCGLPYLESLPEDSELQPG